jgi:orotate phosphoribosyltransferase
VDKRTEEMLELNKLITKYTETYVRPSLSDIYAFDIILNLINEDPEISDHVMKSDIASIWTQIVQSDTVFSLEYGAEQMSEEIMEYLQETGSLIFKDDLEEVEDEDDSDE